MSKIALTPNVSGSGVFTIASPNTNTDRTLTLPDEAGTIATVNGITVADQWRLTTDLTNYNGVLNSNLERVDSSGQGILGAGVSESSGVFTFPSTGLWYVTFELCAANASSVDNVSGQIQLTVDNGSNWNTVGFRTDSLGGVASNQHGVIFLSSLVNVTDTAQVKVRFNVSSFGTTSILLGDTTQTETGMTFIRLGDA
jgi:hypothetical protein